MRNSPGTFEVTMRCIQGRFLLRPSRELNDIILGVLGRALAMHPLLLHIVVVASNHIHLILTTTSVKRMSDFMQYINSNIAREAGWLHGWKEKIFGRRYTAVEITDNETMIKKAAYVLSHGCKEGLVLRPGDWPGVNCVRALTQGKTLEGTWYDRSQQYQANRSGRHAKRTDYATRYKVPMSPLPCFAHMDEGQQRAQIRAMVRQIESATRQQVQRAGRRILGAKKVLAQSPHQRPAKMNKSPAPLCHASDSEERRRYRDDYRWFVTLYRRASERLRAGDLNAVFPANCFPPPMAFCAGGQDPPG